MKSILQKAGLALIAVLLSLFIGELFLRFVYPAQTKYYVWQPNLQHTFNPDTSVLHGISPMAHFSINQYGVRTDAEDLKSSVDLFEQPKNTTHPLNYLCLGGSTTECLYLDDDSTWPMQLKRLAGQQIAFAGNLGKSGCTTRENYIQLKYCVAQYKNIDGVILMVGLNDMLKRLSKDTLYQCGFQFRQPVEDSLANTILLKQGRNLGVTWWRRTAIFYLLQKALHQTNTKGVAWENIEDNRAEVYKTWRTHRAQAQQIMDTLPNLKPALDEFERNLNLIIDEAKKQQLKIIFVNQAALWKDSMSAQDLSLLWMGGIGNYQQKANCAYYSPTALRRALNLYNEKLKAVCHDNGIEMVDVNARLPQDNSTFYDDCHFTNAGAKKVAHIIFNEISTGN